MTSAGGGHPDAGCSHGTEGYATEGGLAAEGGVAVNGVMSKESLVAGASAVRMLAVLAWNEPMVHGVPVPVLSGSSCTGCEQETRGHRASRHTAPKGPSSPSEGRISE